MKELLELVAFDSVFAWTLLAITLVTIAVIPKLFGIRLLNGLIFAQITLFFNAATIIAGLSADAISPERGIHFYSVEFVFMTLMYAVYAHLLQKRTQILSALNRFFDGPAARPFIGFVVLIAIFNFMVTPTDGSSRIEYMTGAWFSLVKPFILLILPMSYLGVFILLLNRRRRRLGYVLLLTTVIANVFTGSKASFAFGLFSAILALRDLSIAPRIQIRAGDKLKVSMFVGAMVVLALTRLNVSPNDLKERFFLFGEANILTYFSGTPTAACENVSTFAKMHRGFARLAGDPSANNIDTLFGYALMIQAVGVNTFTGPNARLSAYALCNFPDESLVLCAIDVLIYFGLLLMLFRRALTRPTYLATLYPYFVVSLAGAAQDFNLIMQDITFYLILLLTTIPLYSKPRHQYG